MTSENEFRINNWVLIEEDGKWTPVQIKGICIASKNKKIEGFSDPFIIHTFGSTVIRYGDDDTEDDFLVKPIPLSYEILEKCELVKGSYFQAFHGKYLSDRMFIINKDTNSFYLTFIDDKDFVIVRLYYLHEIQNIFLYLTRKVLTYNP